MSECAIRSACTRCAPSATNISPTTDLPAAMPPVRPTFSIHAPGTKTFTAEIAEFAEETTEKGFLGGLSDPGGELLFTLATAPARVFPAASSPLLRC